MEFKKGECITILGKRGSGKSFLARKIMQVFPKQVIFDPVCDWTEGEIVGSFEAFAERLKAKKMSSATAFKIVFRFSPDEKNKAEVLNEALRLCYYFQDLQVVIDEVQLFSSPHYMPEYLENLYFIGRHHGVGVTAITQRPSRLNKSCLSQSEHVFCGQLHEKNDISVVADFVGDDVSKFYELKARNFIYFSPTYGKYIFSTEK